jgi:hypothetical protein
MKGQECDHGFWNQEWLYWQMQAVVRRKSGDGTRSHG